MNPVAVAGRRSRSTLLYCLQRAVLLERLGALSGPPLRFHPCLIVPYIQAIQREMPWLEQRLQRQLPLTLQPGEHTSGVRGEADLLDFSSHSLEWLAEASGQRPLKPGQGADTVEGVVEQLAAISGLSAGHRHARILVAEARQRLRRQTLSLLNRC